MRKKLNGCKCSVAGCDRKATGWQDSMPYCNKHWLRIYTNGDVRLHGKKIMEEETWILRNKLKHKENQRIS